MKKYYLMAINKGNVYTMRHLGLYYDLKEKDYDLAKKYYLMAIDKGDRLATYYLGNYYERIEKDYDNALKYFSMKYLKSANKEEECFVCYEENQKMYYTSCNRHYICGRCSVELIFKLCPMCRQIK